MDLNDLFYYDSSWRIIICKECKTVPQTDLYRHIRQYHNTLRVYKPATIKSFVRTLDHLPFIQDANEIDKSFRPLPGAAPIPFLPVFYDGISCKVCEDAAGYYICRGRTALSDHRRNVHGETPRQPGRKCSGSIGGIEGLAKAGLVRTGIPCQTLFRNSRRRYFMVDGKSDARLIDGAGELHGQENNGSSGEMSHPHHGLRDLINFELKASTGSEAVHPSQKANTMSPLLQDVRHQSQWLQMTEWGRFLEPHKDELCKVAALTALPDEMAPWGSIQGEPEAPLRLLLGSLDRIIARARCSLQEGKLNIFDQHRLNSFIAGRSSRRPIIHNMREETYKKYGRVLQHLLCYTFRLAWVNSGPRLHFRLTDGQAMAMAEAVRTALELAESNCDGLNSDQSGQLQKRMDDKCLIFMVSLLDHNLYGDIYDSIVVGFLAALGIRPQSISGGGQKLYDAADFTPETIRTY